MRYDSFGFAVRFRELRQKEGLTQSDIAAAFSVRQTAISSWESGASLPPLEKAAEIADYFRVSLDYLCGRRNSPL